MRWFTSKTYRRAKEMRKQVRKIYRAQEDLLTESEKDNVRQAEARLEEILRDHQPKEACIQAMNNLEKVANENFRSYPHASIRENVEVLLVAVAVALAIRTFFLQPFKIPTGSMQPTLYGITTENLKDEPGVNIPSLPRRLWERWTQGVSYYHLTAEADGVIRIGPVRTLIPFLLSKQDITIGGVKQTLWNPPKNLRQQTRGHHAALLDHAGIREGQFFHQGEEVIKLKVCRGDYLFVDRFTYNWRRPQLGEIIVFETRGIDQLPQDQFYIKRLVAVGPAKVRIGNDRHLVINGKRLDKNTPHFGRIYNFKGPPQKDKYSGHVNGVIAQRYGQSFNVARLFPNESATVEVPEDHYLAMGDNTMNSLDSRAWGYFPQTNVIGKFAFVYWPFTSRFGSNVD